MQLTPDQLTDFAVGVCSIDSTFPRWKPMRMPEPLQPHYATPYGKSARMLCTAGVRVRFVSNTRRLRVSLGFGRRARQFTLSSLLVDGQHVLTFGGAGNATFHEQKVFEADDAQMRSFDLWLPHMCETWVEAIEVDDDASLQAASPLAKTWLVYGDSITQGMTAERPVDTYVGRCSLALDLAACNIAVGGATCDPQLADVVPDVACDVVSIAYGTNDLRRDTTLGDFEAANAALLDALARKHAGVPVVLISPPVSLDGVEKDAHGRTMDEYREVLKQLASGRKRVSYVHGPDLAPADQRYFADKVHPNAAGFETYANAVLPHLRAALGQKLATA